MMHTTSSKDVKRIIQIPMWKTKGSPSLRMEGDATYQMLHATAVIKQDTVPIHLNAPIIVEPVVPLTQQVVKE